MCMRALLQLRVHVHVHTYTYVKGRKIRALYFYAIHGIDCLNFFGYFNRQLQCIYICMYYNAMYVAYKYVYDAHIHTHIYLVKKKNPYVFSYVLFSSFWFFFVIVKSNLAIVTCLPHYLLPNVFSSELSHF